MVSFSMKVDLAYPELTLSLRKPTRLVMEKFDVCVIGGGPAGYASAMRALDFGKSVLLVEKD